MASEEEYIPHMRREITHTVVSRWHEEKWEALVHRQHSKGSITPATGTSSLEVSVVRSEDVDGYV